MVTRWTATTWMFLQTVAHSVFDQCVPEIIRCTAIGIIVDYPIADSTCEFITNNMKSLINQNL